MKQPKQIKKAVRVVRSSDYYVNNYEDMEDLPYDTADEALAILEQLMDVALDAKDFRWAKQLRSRMQRTKQTWETHGVVIV